MRCWVWREEAAFPDGFVRIPLETRFVADCGMQYFTYQKKNSSGCDCCKIFRGKGIINVESIVRLR